MQPCFFFVCFVLGKLHKVLDVILGFFYREIQAWAPSENVLITELGYFYEVSSYKKSQIY